MTDPYMWNGWVTNEGFGGFNHQEVGDHCEGDNQPLTAVLNAPPLTAGSSFLVQKLSDNASQTCSAFTRATSSTLAVTRGDPAAIDVFWPVPPRIVAGGGALGHAWLSGGTWHSETVRSGQSAFFVGAPTAVSTTSGRLDVYIRELNGQLGHFARATPTSGWTFSVPTVNGTASTINASAQPFAVTSSTNRTDIVVRNWDSSVGHYWSNDNRAFSFETFSAQTIGPPVITTLGSNNLDVFTYGMHGGPAIDSFRNGSGWSGFRALVPGGDDRIPVPLAVAYGGTMTQSAPFDEIVFAATGAGTTSGTQWYQPSMTATNAAGSWRQQYFTFN